MRRGHEVVVDQELPNTLVGKSTRTEIEDRLFTGLSVEMQVLSSAKRGGVREIASATMVAERHGTTLSTLFLLEEVEQQDSGADESARPTQCP